ncbi:unnamed protein product, partial [Anisakis simplex]|uniref:Uncharacterized protein n=1 Tax=Anisakis simplex TaxID=6269 RepID=A0A0M3JKQ2_ANISI
MSTQNQHHQPPTTAQSQHVFSISSSDGIFNVSGNVANITGQSGAGTDSTEDGPDIVELP